MASMKRNMPLVFMKKTMAALLKVTKQHIIHLKGVFCKF